MNDAIVYVCIYVNSSFNDLKIDDTRIFIFECDYHLIRY